MREKSRFLLMSELSATGTLAQKISFRVAGHPTTIRAREPVMAIGLLIKKSSPYLKAAWKRSSRKPRSIFNTDVVGIEMLLYDCRPAGQPDALQL